MLKHFLITLFTLALFLACNANENKEVQPNPIKKKISMMTYNIHHGVPENSTVVSLSNIAAVIKNSGAELIALQEVDVDVLRSGKVNQPAELGKLLGMDYYFSKSIDLGVGEYGVAILSKYPLTNTRRETLPSPISGELRSVALATVTLPNGTTFEFGSTHLDLNVPNRTAQAEHLNKLGKTIDKPLFIGGDFNAEPNDAELVRIKEEFTLSCKNECPVSFPVRNPQKAIDFFIFNKKASGIYDLLYSVALNNQYASDHLPVLSVFQFD